MSENFLTSDDQFHFNCELKTKRSAFYGIYIIIRTFIRNVWLTIRRISIYILEVKAFNVNSGVQEKINRNLRHFYLARHFIGTISLYFDFFLLTVVVFVFDSIVIVNRFLLCIYCNACNAHLIIFIESAYYHYYYWYHHHHRHHHYCCCCCYYYY